VLLPSDTCRKPITAITAVLLPFVGYLLTLPHIYINNVILVCEFTMLSVAGIHERRILYIRIASIGKKIAELERIWKEVAMA
jgi:hypothetical protein